MTGARTAARRFPAGLSLVAAVALATLVALGVWQLQRLKWKEALLGKIAALQHGAPRPVGPVLQVARGGSAEFTRVEVTCAPPPRPSPAVYRYSLRDGRIGWRLLSECPLAEAGPYDGVLLDRGLVDRFSGVMAPSPATFPVPASVTGILRAPGVASSFGASGPTADNGVLAFRMVDAAALRDVARRSGLSRPAPYLLAVESERPAPVGVRPAALPEAIANNHFIYALTWFGLAGALAGVYIAMLAGRLRRR